MPVYYFEEKDQIVSVRFIFFLSSAPVMLTYQLLHPQYKSLVNDFPVFFDPAKARV